MTSIAKNRVRWRYVGDIQADKEYLCLRCKQWKLRRAFSVDKTGYLNPDEVKAKCKECQSAYFKEWYRRRGSEMKKERVSLTLKREAEAHHRFMENNVRRMDFGLNPIIQTPGVAGIKIASTVEAAKEVVLKWKADQEHKKSEIFKLEQEIAELKKKMMLTTHLSTQTVIYTEQLAKLLAKLEQWEKQDNESTRVSDNGRAMGVEREGVAGGVSGQAEQT